MFDSIRYRIRRFFSSTETKLLSIGMENSSFAGQCPGAGTGASNLYKRISPGCKYSKLLLNDKATKAAVASEMSKVCNSDLAIITYCGHGGRQRGSKNESDGYDEFLGLWDGKFMDNDIWNIVSKAKGRVFMIFDCCHSETMFCDNWRDKFQTVMIAGLPFGSLDLLCWSACSEDQFSYTVQGAGGFLARSILKHADPAFSYDKVWDKISHDKSVLKHEIVKQTLLKSDSAFHKNKVFF